MSINLVRALILFGAFALSLLSANAKTLDGIAIESAQFLGVKPDDSDIDALVVKTQFCSTAPASRLAKSTESSARMSRRRYAPIRRPTAYLRR